MLIRTMTIAAVALVGACTQDKDAVRTEIRAAEAAAAKAAEEAAAKSAAFLETNKAKEGVVVTPSGLQYEKVRTLPGSGPRPSAADTVIAHYEGTLVDGTKFDSSYDRGEPAEFPLGGVIPGWTEGLQLMRPGEEYRFVIPPELGYGPDGAGGVIPPNATLIFKVELESFTTPQGRTVRKP
jgi:FKBP-type peptidyl-prolyl cis-trans isomerase